MRLVSLAILVMAVTGCTGGSGIDALHIRPSNEVTNSIASRPTGEVGSDGVAAMIGATPEDGARADPFASAAQEVALVIPESQVARAGRLKIYGQRFRDAKPVRFKGADPYPFQVHGVDVSHWQGDIDWKTLRKQGANFAFLKATEGGKHVDRLFATNWRKARAAGIATGAYHFFYWCRSAEEQARWFIRHVPKQAGALPPVLDVEWNGNKRTCPGKLPRARVLEKMQVWLDIVKRHYGVKPIIYTAPDFYKDNLRGQFTDYSFWLRSVAAHPEQVYPGRDWAFWQYSGTGLSSGVANHIDLNVFNGTAESWQRWVGKRAL
jgi:lysozyme